MALWLPKTTPGYRVLRSYFWMAVAILTCPVCFGQPLSIGVIGGGMVSNDLGGQWLKSVSMRYVIGPQLDIGLPLGFGIEIDGLYRNQGYQTTFNAAYSEQYATSWEFPVLLKKSLSFPVVKLFAEAGWAPRVLQTSWKSTLTQGFVIGGGVEFRIARLCLTPAVRYTRWNDRPILLVIPNGPSPTLTANQVDVLLGISWKLR